MQIDKTEIGAMLARCYMSLSDAWTYANAVERQTKGYDAVKYGGLRRDINTVMELAGRLVQEYKS